MNIQLKKLRKRKGISQEEMAVSLGIKTSRYGTWERGERMPSLEQAYNCAVILGCTIDEICGYNPPKKTYTDPLQERLNGYYESMNEKGQSLLVESAKHMSSSTELRIEKERQYPYNQTAMGA